MPRAFDITATTSSVQLGGSGQGEVSFTVSNKLGMGVHVRATVEPAGDTRAEWMRFPEGRERTLSPDGTAVTPVRVELPPGTPPGSYGFNLVVASVSNPDEHYARGPSVAFTTAAAPVPVKKPFPWWLAGLAAGVLLISGVVAFLLLRDGDDTGGTGGSGELPGLSRPCAEGEPRCAEGLVCTEEERCLGELGFACVEDGECASGLCEEGTCQSAVEPGGRCAEDGDCERPARCESGLCRLPDGQPCTSLLQCLSRRCEEGTCEARVAPGGRCEDSTDCEGPSRCVNDKCGLRQGASCRRDAECQSDNCEGGTCRPPGCSPPCGPGLMCSRGRCAIVRRHCDSDRDCEAPMRCGDGTCRLPSGSPCANDSQCLSGSCERSRCR